jgi:hypothetical protein
VIKKPLRHTFFTAGDEKVLDINSGINYGGKLIVTFDNKDLLKLGLNLSQSDFMKSDLNYSCEHFNMLYVSIRLHY